MVFVAAGFYLGWPEILACAVVIGVAGLILLGVRLTRKGGE